MLLFFRKFARAIAYSLSLLRAIASLQSSNGMAIAWVGNGELGGRSLFLKSTEWRSLG
jgi:hypothetical protein